MAAADDHDYGVGMPCPGCAAWWRTVDDLVEHLDVEHPALAERLTAASVSTEGRDRGRVRGAMLRMSA